MNIAYITEGFIEIPGQISLNIYVQGCSIGCKGCQNANLQSFIDGIGIAEDQMQDVLNRYELPTWVCWLGGEPTDQPEDFVKFNKLFNRNNYKVCLYTGRLFKDIQHLLDNVDLVIDGPWQGIPITQENTNQKVYRKDSNEWVNISYSMLRNKNANNINI